MEDWLGSFVSLKGCGGEGDFFTALLTKAWAASVEMAIRGLVEGEATTVEIQVGKDRYSREDRDPRGSSLRSE
jgi:hypothetical protein